MNYKDQYKQAQKNGQIYALTAIFKKDWKKNEEIIGRLVSIESIPNPKFKKDYWSYLFNTDEGNIKTSLGANVDSEVRPFMAIGDIYRVQYIESIDTGKGNKMRVFKVEHILADEEPQPELASGELPLDKE